MKLIWNGHACFTVEMEDGAVVIDPYEDGYVPGLSNLDLTAGMVLCSHGHRDHSAAGVVTMTDHAPKVEIERILTYHDDQQGALRGTSLIHVLSAEGLRIAHLGDVGGPLTEEQLQQLGDLDALLIPVGGYYTIDAQQAHALAEQISARVVIPMHYRSDTFGYDVLAPVEDFLALREYVVRYPGNTLELTRDTPPQTAVLTYQG